MKRAVHCFLVLACAAAWAASTSRAGASAPAPAAAEDSRAEARSGCRPGSACDGQSGDGPVLRLEATPIPAEVGRRMSRWHDAYRRAMAGVLAEWEAVRRAAARPHAGEHLAAGCRRLGAALAGVQRRALMAAPDAGVAVHLDRTLRHLGDAVDSCTHGARFLTTWRLERAARSLAALHARLRIYGIEP